MLQELNIQDFYLLTSKETCSKYVVMLANKLDTVFLTLKLMPSMGAAGTILFRPIRQLEKPETTEEELNRQSLCMFIAYFYIRIFQIYGALSLTLIDDVKTFMDSGIIQASQEQLRYLSQAGLLGTVGNVYGRTSIRTTPDEQPTGSRLSAYDNILRQQQQRLSRRYGTIGSRYGYDSYYRGGGKASEVLSNTPFDFMKRFVDPDDPGSNESIRVDGKQEQFDLGYTLDVPNTPNTYFSIGNVSNQRDTREGYIFIFTSKSPKIPYGIIQVKVTGKRLQNGYALIFDGTRLNRIKPPARGDDVPYDLNLHKIFPQIRIDNQGNLIDGNIPLALKLSEYINKIIKLETTSGVKQEEVLKSIIDSDDTYSSWSTQQQRRRTITPALSSMKFWVTDDKAPVHLRLKRTFEALTKTREIGSCVSRGLQLLNALSGQSTVWKSSICDKSFLVTTNRVDRDGGVQAGEALDKHSGMMAAAELFFDVVANNQVGVTQETHKGINEYANFLKTMDALYGRTLTEPAQDRRLESLADISNRYLSDACSTVGKSLQQNPELDATTTKDVWGQVIKLFQIQASQAKKCGIVFNALFFIDKKGAGKPYISINPTLLKGGVPKLDSITKYARNILLDYYSGCETEFQKGVATIVKSREEPKADSKVDSKADKTAVNPAINPAVNPAVKPAVNPAAVKPGAINPKAVTQKRVGFAPGAGAGAGGGSRTRKRRRV